MNELISRQAAIDALKEVSEHYTDKGREWHPHVNFMVQAIKELPSANQWIPCSERLPNDETDILVTYVDGEETRIVPVNYGRGIWFDCMFNRELNPHMVTAWMPLPEPWKGEENA